MSRYIDAEILAERFYRAWNLAETKGDKDIEYTMANIVTPLLVGTPTADVVEVVRCKDCKYYSTAKVNWKGYLICLVTGMEIKDNDYCSYSEKKESE